MRSIYLAAALAALLCACERLPENSAHNRGPGNRGWIFRDGDDSPEDIPAAKDTTVYTLGIEYPASYDWKRDTAYGNVGCRIVVFANQKRILEAEAGPGTMLSADPDMHRIWDGVLWSDWSDGSHTVISRNGEEAFRYEGNEMICGFMVHGGAVHTLGRSRSGKGFSYRIDGELILSDSSGIPVGDPYSTPEETGIMYLDQGEVCFGFRRNENGTDRWYAVRSGKAEPADCGVRLSEVFDIRYIDGRLHMAGTSPSNGGRLVHVCEGVVDQLWRSEAKVTNFCHMMPSGGKLFFYVGYVRLDGKTESCLWKDRGSIISYGTDYAGFWVSEGQYAQIALNSEGLLGTVRAGSGYWWFKDSLVLMSHQCVRYDEGALLIAATPVRKELSPVMWKNGRSLALTLHGYLGGIYASHGSIPEED